MCLMMTWDILRKTVENVLFKIVCYVAGTGVECVLFIIFMFDSMRDWNIYIIKKYM